MREIRPLNESHLDAYADIAFNAYPSFKDFNEDAMDAYKAVALDIMKNDPIVTFYGMFEGDKLIGVMRLFDFQMNAFGKIVPISGLGFLGVHLMHKKQGVARQLVEFYEKHYLERQIPIASLLPFRPDFYKTMGYGFGTKMNQYRLPLTELPAYEGFSDLRYMTPHELGEILSCHSRVVGKSHGRIMKFGDEIRDLFGDAFNRVIGNYDEQGHLTGYMVYQFKNGKAGNYTINHLYLKELVYENTTALRQMLGFLRKQADQVALIVISTEDEHFHYLLNNPLNDTHNYIPYGYLETNTQAIGMMYKILDVPLAFAQCSHRHYNQVALKVRFEIVDSFTKNTEHHVVHFGGGQVVLGGQDYDVTARIDVADFSSLFMAAATARGLYDLGRLTLDNEAFIEALDLAFYYPQKPVCYTDF